MDFHIEAICNTAVETDRVATLRSITDHYRIQPGYTVYGEEAASHPYYSKFTCKMNARSLAINHITLLEKYKDATKPLLLFESDVLCLYPFEYIDTQLAQIVKDMRTHQIDFVFLGKGCFQDTQAILPRVGPRITGGLYQSTTSRCTEAFLISPQGIRAYLEFFYTAPLHKAIDADFNELFRVRPEIRCAWAIPELFRQGSEAGLYKSRVPN
jgi:hypothetical protein